MKIFKFFLVSFLLFAFFNCKKENNNDTDIIPKVTTTEVTEIKEKSAIVNGVITENGNSEIIQKGIVWGLSLNPSISDNVVIDSLQNTSISVIIDSLIPGTTYHIRAFATNSDGTGYGESISFETLGIDGTFTDNRDNNTYNTKLIGEQVWMIDNLRYLPSVMNSTVNSYTEVCYYVYDYNGTDVTTAKETLNYDTYGVLYNWFSAKDACPEGWKLPSDDDYDILFNYLADNGYNYDGSFGGGRNKTAKAISSISNWEYSSNTGAVGNTDFNEYRNKSGFTALPGGVVNYISHSFVFIQRSGYYWTNTEVSQELANAIPITHANVGILEYYGNKRWGFSVRCVRD